jgi:hypothetical protein
MLGALLLGIGANAVAELLLSCELHMPWRALGVGARWLRVLRWVALLAGQGALAWRGIGMFAQINVALFAIMAATDLESRTIPPDLLTYGAVLLACVFGLTTGGVDGLRGVVVAQALCFSAMLVAVLFFNAADAGDIKVLMHYGAACGSLAVVGIGVIAETVLRAIVLLIAFARLGKPAAALRLPHAPFAWVGLLFALFWVR